MSGDQSLKRNLFVQPRVVSIFQGIFDKEDPMFFNARLLYSQVRKLEGILILKRLLLALQVMLSQGSGLLKISSNLTNHKLYIIFINEPVVLLSTRK